MENPQKKSKMKIWIKKVENFFKMNLKSMVYSFFPLIMLKWNKLEQMEDCKCLARVDLQDSGLHCRIQTTKKTSFWRRSKSTVLVFFFSVLVPE